MNPLRTVLILLALFGPAAGLTNGQASGDADSQLWSETRLTYKIDPKFDIFAAGAYRLTKDFSDFTRVSGRFGGSWSPIPTVSIAPSYYYTVNDPWTSSPRSESRLCLLTSYQIPIQATILTLANTTEYRMPQNGPDSWWLRPKIQVAHPVGPEKWGLSAFAADEIFYNNQRDVFTQDQVFAGFQKKFNDSLTASLYYCRKVPMNTTNSSANVICVDFRITFGPKGPSPLEPSFR